MLPQRVLPLPAAARHIGVQTQAIRKAIGKGRLAVPMMFASPDGRSRKRYVSLESFIDLYDCEEEDCLQGFPYRYTIVSHTGREFEILSDQTEVIEEVAV